MLKDVLARIEHRLKVVGIAASAASTTAGVSIDAIRNLKRAVKDGKRKGISTSTLVALAPVLKTNVAWLLDGVGDENAIAPASMSRVPLISWVSAGRPETPDSVTDLDGCEILEMSGLPDGEWFALNVEGDSMDRISPPGSVIVANRRERQLVPNACYVIALEDGSATYKRYRASPSRFEPVSVNPAHEAIFPDGAVRIIGRVRRSILEM